MPRRKSGQTSASTSGATVVINKKQQQKDKQKNVNHSKSNSKNEIQSHTHTDRKPKKTFGTKQVLSSPYAPIFPSPAPGTYEHVLRALQRLNNGSSNGIIVGVNGVTRALEKMHKDNQKQLQVVVCSRDVKPGILVAHIPTLCYVKQVNLVAMPGDGTEVAKALGRGMGMKMGMGMGTQTNKVNGIKGMKRTLVFGVYSCSEVDRQELINDLNHVKCQLDFPWLKEFHNINDKENDVDMPKGGLLLPTPKLIEHRYKEQRQVVESDEVAKVEQGVASVTADD